MATAQRRRTVLAVLPLLGVLAQPAACKTPAAGEDFVIALPLGDAAGAARYVHDISTPGSPLLHRFLTPGQFAARFGGDPAAVDRVRRWAAARGFAVGAVNTARTLVQLHAPGVSPTDADLASLADCTLGLVAPGRDDVAAAPASADHAHSDRSPAGGQVWIRHGTLPAPASKIAPDGAGGTGPGGAYAAADLRAAYSIQLPIPGSAAVVATFARGGFDPGDIAEYAAVNGIANPAVTFRGVNGYGGTVDDLTVEAQAVTDVDMILAADPVAHVIVYEDDNPTLRLAVLRSLTVMADDNRADIVDIAYGEDEGLDSRALIAAENQVLMQMAAQGQTVFAASGNGGAYGNSVGPSRQVYNVLNPASQPLVTSVGGTTLFTNGNEQYLEEIGWPFSGGGVSAVWALPIWQRYGSQIIAESVFHDNGGSDTMRNLPDVSAVADPLTGVAVYSRDNGGWLQAGGTGVASAIWAGVLAQADGIRTAAGLQTRLGFFNPMLYLRNQLTAELNQASNNDIFYGTNGTLQPLSAQYSGYTAGGGADNVTGWGSPVGPNSLSYYVTDATFAAQLPEVTNFDAKSTPTTLKLSWSPVQGATAYLLELYPTGLLGVAKGTSFTFAGLTPNTFYEVGITPVSPDTRRAVQNVVYATTP